VTQMFGGIVGLLLVMTVWLSVLRTVFIPRQRSTRAARWTVKVVAAIGLALARQLPARACRLRERLLELCTPVALMAMAVVWLAADAIGFTLLAWAVADVPLRGEPLSAFFLLRTSAAPLAGLGLLSMALLLAAFTTHLVRLTDAYSRRERLVALLAGQAVQPSNAEEVVANYMRAGGSREHLDNLFNEWAGWMSDVQATHIGYPALLYYRPAGQLNWIRAAMIVLDAAALTLAMAPSWAPPNARSLTAIGARTMQRLAAQLGLVLPATPVSLHGREENRFTDTLELAVRGGVPREHDEQTTWNAFQDLRTQYAPYAAAIYALLLYETDAPDDDVKGPTDALGRKTIPSLC
jgi:hypothetical protein